MKDETKKFSRLSLISITLTVIFSMTALALQYGTHALILGAILLLLIFGIVSLCMKTHSKWLVIAYGLMTAAIIGVNGFYLGFWNHFMKVSLYYLHNQQLPSFFAKLFIVPTLGSGIYETLGILSFFASLAAANYTLKSVQRFRKEAL